MAVKMDEFLLQYYMQYRFNHMPPGVRAQFDVYVKSDDFRGNMKMWKNKLMHQNANGKWVENDMPDPNNSSDEFFLNDKEWEKFFVAFQNAFINMNADRENLEKNSPDALKFLDEYFGSLSTHLFTNNVANVAAESVINHEFKDFLNRYRTRLEIQFQQWGILDKEFTYSKLMSGISSGEYNKSATFQKKIKKIAQYIDAYSNSDEFRNILRLNPGESIPDFSPIINGFDENNVDPAKMDLFRGTATTRGRYLALLNTLATNKKVYNVFKQYDDGKISGKLEEAKSKLDYDNKEKEDYVPPKRNEELTLFEKLRGDISDTLEDYMGKYLKLTGDRLYFSESAKLIVKAIDGTNYKSTDGLKKILDSKSDIKKKLLYKSPRATEQFDWFIGTMEDLNASMPKTFAGALNNGGKLQAIVEELILKAVHENKIDEAKTAMEILSIVKYSYTNSKIMEAFNKSDFTIFSDKDLSFNKGGIEFVTKAFDKALKKSLQVVGYTATVAINAIKMSGSKFDGHTKRIGGVRSAWIDKNEADRSAAEQRRNVEGALDDRTIASQEGVLRGLDSAGFNETTMPRRKRQLQLAQDSAKTAHDDYVRAKENFESADNIVNARQQVTNLLRQRQALGQEISDLDRDFANPATYAGLTSEAASAKAQDILTRKREKEAERKQKYEDVRVLISNLRSVYTRDQIRNAVRERPALLSAMQAAERRYNTRQGYSDYIEQHINDFDNATKALNESREHKTKLENTVNNWDQEHLDRYKELVVFWDMLETGRNLHLGKFYSWSLGSAKNKQREFDNIKLAMFNQKVADYNLAA